MKKVIFVSGVYGVGKSTLCMNIAARLHLPYYSAGDLISEINGETYGRNKVVKDKNANQDILINRIEDKLEEYDSLLLAGHFSILGKNGDAELLPIEKYDDMHISSIILLESELNQIIDNLKGRDGKTYSKSQVEKIMSKERDMADAVSKRLGVPLLIHRMNFSNIDVDACCDFIMEV